MKTDSAAGMVTLSCENPCGDVHMVDGIPQTSQDPSFHGFGMKSIERTANCYGGTVSCLVRDNLFTVTVVLLPE